MQKQIMKISGAPEGAPFLEVLIANRFFSRLAGLMFRKELPEATGLLLTSCNSVHMCFMCFAIDVIYLDQEYRVIKVIENLRPWIGLSICSKAWATLEMNAGEAKRYGLAVGKKLTVVVDDQSSMFTSV